MVSLLLLIPFVAANPTTKPTNRELQFAKWVGDLDNPSAPVRQVAAQELMQLRRSDLPLLKAVTVQAKPLTPGQRVVLRDVVMQVYLAEEPYERSKDGFLGMVMTTDNVFFQEEVPAGVPGIPVIDRMLGFAAYRSLMNGDVILEIKESPGSRFTRYNAFSSIVSSFKPDTTLHLVVLRQGREITVPITLSAKPSFVGDAEQRRSVEQFTQERLTAAEKYYDTEFAPALEDHVSRAD